MRGFNSLPDKEPKSFKSMDIISLQVSLSPLGYGFNGEE